MKTLAQQFEALTALQKQLVQFRLCGYALEKWRQYAEAQESISYIETVCGTCLQVDLQLPEDAFASAQERRDLAGVEMRYREPIVSMQDLDLEFPEPVEFAYYSIYNLFLRYAVGEPIADWLIVNQALASETEQQHWQRMLEEAINSAKVEAPS